ncbi:MAG: phage tail tape measure protein [Sphingobacteriaceae bacterium]|nr:phage tail tape measure protein [Sphingobacteriaceae bacterium]
MGAEIPKSIKATLFIDGKPASNTMKGLEADAKRCLLELKNLEKGTDAWNKKMKELQSHRRELAGLNSQINETAGLFGFLKTEVGKFGALAAGYLGFQFITDEFRNIIMGNAELSDSFADVRKTTGLTEEGVRRLAVEFKNINTRTPQKQLLGLAEVAGKLGVSGERDVLGFVRAADKISVALGKDLGDAEAAINNIGKLVELFKVKEAYGLEDSMIRTGSAINALGAAGTASEAYLVEFSKRMGGIAPQANFSIESILGLAATMDELGQPVEASATAIGQFVTGIGKDLPGFARIAGMSVKDFSKLLKEDGNKALLEVLKNLKSTGDGVQGLAEKMGMVGEDGARGVAALGALSNNLDLLVTRQKLANDEFAKGTSLQNEYNIKNENFAAVLEKTGKTVKSLTSNAVLTDFLKNLVIGFKDLLDWGNKNAVVLVNFTKLLLVGAIAWGAYRAAILLSTFAMDAYAARIVLARAATISFAGIQALLTGNTLRAQAAMRALNLTTAANPFVAVATAVIALIAAVALFSKTTSEAQRVQSALNDIEAEASKNRNDEIQTIKELKSVLDSENTTREQKLKAMGRLREVMPAALQHLKDEEILTTQGTIAINKYIKALEEKTLAEAAQSKIRKLQERNIEIENGAVNDTSIWQDVKAFAVSGNIDQFKANQKTAGKGNALEEFEENQRQIKAIQEKYGSGMVNNLLTTDDVTTGGKSTGGLTPSNAKSKAESAANKALTEFEQLNEEYKKLGLQRLNDKLSQNEREVAQESQKYDKLIEKEKAFLKMKGNTPGQRNQTTANISSLEAEKEKAVSDLRLRQEADMADKIKDLRIGLANVHESELQRERVNINKFYDDIEKDYVGNETVLAQLKADRLSDLSNAELREKERLEREKLEIEDKYETLNGNKSENKLAKINKKYDDEIEALKRKFSKELQLTQSFQDAVASINKTRQQEIDNYTNTSAEDKKNFQVEMAQLAADTVFTIGANNRRAEADAAISELERQRSQELSNKNLTEKQKTAINEKFDKKLKAEKEKAWKAERNAAIAQAVINGALAVTKVLAQTGVLSPFVIPAIVAGTLAQITVIAAQKPPQFAKGGFSNSDPAGYVDKETYFAKSATGRPFVAGEAGREWIAPNWMLQNPRTANIIGMLEAARQEKRAFAMGGFNDAGQAPAQQINMPSINFDTTKLEDRLDRLIGAAEDAWNMNTFTKRKAEYDKVRAEAGA